MKKSLLFLFLSIISFNLKSQALHYFMRPSSLYAEQFHGTKVCYDSIISDLSLDSNQCFFNSFVSTFYGEGAYVGDYVYKDSLTGQRGVIDKYRMEFVYDTSLNVLRPVVYSKWQVNSMFFPIPDGTTSQYLRGDGSAAAFPSIPSNTNQLTNGAGFITATYFSSGTGISISSGLITNTSPDQTVSIGAGTGISVTGTYPSFTITNSLPSPVVSIDTIGIIRSFNSNFQPSTTKASHVSYSIRIACTLTLSGGQYGTVVLQQSANGTTGWKEVARCENGNTGTLTVGLSTVQTQCFTIDADINAGWYVKIATTNTTGTPTFTYVNGREEIY